MKRNHLLFGMLGCAAFAMAGFGVGALLGTSKVTTASATPTTKTINARTTTSVYSGDLYAYMWVDVSDGSTTTTYKNADWPGAKMTATTSGSYTDYSLVGYTNGVTQGLFTNVIFNSGSGTGAIQTANLGLDIVNNISSSQTLSFVINNTNWSSSITGGWDHLDSHVFTSNYYRIWANRGTVGTDSGNFYTFHYYDSGSIDEELMPTGYGTASDSWSLPYWDVPKAVIGKSIQFKMYYQGSNWGATASTLEDGTTACTYADGDNSEIYHVYSKSSVYYYSRGAAGSTAGIIKAAMLEQVFGGYFTCSSDKNNGYGAFAQVADTFVKRSDGTWLITGNMTDVSFSDATYVSGTSDYSTVYQAGTRGSTTSAQEKYDMMLAKYNAANPTTPSITLFNGNQNHDSTVVIVMITAATAIFTAGSLLLLKKKKRA